VANKLLIVESPGKIRKLSQILGPGWSVAASVGHVRDLPMKTLGVAPPEFRPQYEFTERGRSVTNKLLDLVAQAGEVYLATDPDREGEAISWHLQQVLKLSRPKRVTFGEITEAAVRHAVAHPRQIDANLVSAQETRRVLDRLVGYTVSPIVSRVCQATLSAGRVQSVAVRLVVDRERAIRTFKSTTHYSAELSFAGATPWTAEWKLAPEFINDEHPYFLDKAFAKRVANSDPVTVERCTDTEARRSPPPPFTTSTLQQAASAALKLDPKRTMEIAQRLYEEGLISYHRTDNPNLSDEAILEIQTYCRPLKLPVLAKPRRFQAKAGAQEAHEAIRPTHFDRKVAGENSEEEALYKLIRLRAIASQMEDARYAVRTLVLSAPDLDGKPIRFQAQGRTLVYRGWLIATAGDQTVEDPDADTQDLPQLAAGIVLHPVSGRVLEKTTKPPSRYTQASLIKKLESEEIGRPSTYASILDNIRKRGYVEEKRRFLYASPLAEQLIDALVGTFSFLEIGFTRAMEAELDAIAQGNQAYLPVVAAAYAQLQTELSKLSRDGPAGVACTVCKHDGCVYPAKSKRGTVYWKCQHCQAAFVDLSGHPGEPMGAARTASSIPADAPTCPTCKKHKLVQATGNGRPYWRCTGYPTCRALFSDQNGKPGTPFGEVKKFPTAKKPDGKKKGGGTRKSARSKQDGSGGIDDGLL